MYAFDIETEAWDTFVLGGILSDTGEWWVYDHTQEEEYATHLLSLHGELWAHNGGRYDAIWLCEWIRRLRHKLGIKARVFATSARITLIQVSKKSGGKDNRYRAGSKYLEIRDSAALCPFPLEFAARIGGREKLATNLACVCGNSCGGYCAIHRGMESSDKERLKTYLRGDCECVLSLIQALRSYGDLHQICIEGTVGASAWKTARADLDLPSAKWNPPRLYNRAREGYYGGRVQVFRPISARGNRWDINSAYVAALTQCKLPVGEVSEITAQQASQAYRRGQEGIYSARVKVEKQHIPPLPWRHNDRVWYPYGEFWGTWTGLELRYAEGHRVKVLEHGPALVWPEAEMVLKPWAERIWSLRDKAGQSSPLGKWLKWVGNSLTGKLAQRPETDHCEILPESPPGCDASFICGGILCGMSNRCCVHRCIGSCGSWRPLGRSTGVWFKETFRIASNAHVQWAAYLTAKARTTLHAQLVGDGENGKTAVYCDTDSVIAERTCANNVGNNLGQFKFEGGYRCFRALAPKTYSYIDDKGERQVRAKGVPNPEWTDILQGLPQKIDRGVQQFRSAVRNAGEHGSMFQRRDSHRRVAEDRFGDRILHPGDEWTSAQAFTEIA